MAVEITYDLGANDLKAFNEHLLSAVGLPNIRREALINAGTAAVSVALLIYVAERNVPAALVVAAVVGIVVGVAWPSVRKNQVKKAIPNAITRLHEGSRADGILGSHVLRLGSDGVVDQTAVSETRHSWSGISEVHVTDGYLYLFVRPLTAFIVPRHAVPNLEAVLEELKGHVGEPAIHRFEQHAA